MSARLKLYRGKTHTQPIVEDPMRSGEDELMDDILSLVRCACFACWACWAKWDMGGMLGRSGSCGCAPASMCTAAAAAGTQMLYMRPPVFSPRPPAPCAQVTGKPEVHSQFPMLPSLVIDLASWVCPF